MEFFLPFTAAIGFHVFPYRMKIIMQTLQTCVLCHSSQPVFIFVKVTLLLPDTATKYIECLYCIPIEEI